MKWFKHATNASTSAAVTRLENLFGAAGYSMLFKLQELIASHLEHKDQQPSIHLPRKEWCKILRCRARTLDKFFEELVQLDLIKVEEDDRALSVTMPSIRDSLDNRAVSSALRVSTGLPRTDKDKTRREKDQQQQKPDNADKSFSWLTEPLKDSDAKQSIPFLIFRKFIRGKIKKSDLPKIESLIRHQFKISEKSIRQGEVVIRDVRKAFAIGTGYLALDESLRTRVSEDFFAKTISTLHVAPLEVDRNFSAAWERCKSKCMSAEDILYVKSKGAFKKDLELNWINKYEDILKTQLSN